jgi:hypothetical protein
VNLPGPLPPPLEGLRKQKLPIVNKNIHWFRSHSLTQSPIFFGREQRFRFDSPNGQYGVPYVAQDQPGAFIETFGQLYNKQVNLPRSLTSTVLSTRAVSELACEQSLRLVDLTGSGLARIGADSRLHSADYEASQRWSEALHGHPDAPDGILYRSRHDPDRKVAAIFNASLKWRELYRQPWITLGPGLRSILSKYQFSLIDCQLVPMARKRPVQRSLHLPFP